MTRRSRSILAGAPAVVLSLVLLLAMGGAGASAAEPRSMRAADFLDTLGVNIHLTYGNTPYRSVEGVAAALRYIGISHVRDGAFSSEPQAVQRFSRLAESGAAFDFVLWPPRFPQIVETVRAFHRAHPGALAAVEGPNEVNNFAISYLGTSGNTAAIRFQTDLYALVKGDEQLANVPIYDFTSGPIAVGPADFANFHTYARQGAQPRRRMMKDKASAQKPWPGRPIVLTETGYPTVLGTEDGVDEATQAKLLLNTVFDAALFGVSRTYIYELFDEHADGDTPRNRNHFGLFDIQREPKLAAHAFHNLTRIIRDEGSNAASFAMTDFNYSVDGLSDADGSLLLEKSSGAKLIVVWREPAVWDAKAHRPISVAAEPVALSLAGGRSDVRIYDPLESSDPVETHRSIATVRFDVRDRLVILEVMPAG